MNEQIGKGKLSIFPSQRIFMRCCAQPRDGRLMYVYGHEVYMGLLEAAAHVVVRMAFAFARAGAMDLVLSAAVRNGEHSSRVCLI